MKEAKLELLLLNFDVKNLDKKAIIGVWHNEKIVITVKVTTIYRRKYFIEIVKLEGTQATTIYEIANENIVTDTIWQLVADMKKVVSKSATDSNPTPIAVKTTQS